MARARKGIKGGRAPLVEPLHFGDATLRFGDAAWARIVQTLPPDRTPRAHHLPPQAMPPDKMDGLREDIEWACGAFLARTTQLRKDIGSAAALRPPQWRAGERAPFERLAHHLKQAAAAWDEIGANRRLVRCLQESDGLERQAVERQAGLKRQAVERQAEVNAYADQMYEQEMQEWRDAITCMSSLPTKSNDDPLVEVARVAEAAEGVRNDETAEAEWNDEVGGDFHDNVGGAAGYDRLAGMAKLAQLQLKGLRKLGPPTKITDANNPFGLLVGDMARAWERAGLKPDANGRYGSPPTDFQRFMAEIDRSLLGSKKLIHFDVLKRTPDGLPTQNPRDPKIKAFYVEIARWLREPP
jgi:hypothetical protein